MTTHDITDRAARCFKAYKVITDPLGMYEGAVWPAFDLDDININEEGYEGGFPPIGMEVVRLERTSRNNPFQPAGRFVFNGERLVRRE